MLRFLERVSGYSRQQIARLVKRGGERRAMVKRYCGSRTSFARTYTGADMFLLAQTDTLHGTLSGLATKKLMERAYGIFGDIRYQRLAIISVAHLYNLRQRPSHLHKRQVWTKTRPTGVPIGERRAPAPNNRPGYLRVDSVHQGDQDGVKGVYHINAVDCVTQYEGVATCERISEAFLIPVLEALLQSFPFVILGFHTDNGSEYINRDVAKLLNKLLIEEQTKSRSRHSNDNAQAESKNGAIVRKHLALGSLPDHTLSPLRSLSVPVRLGQRHPQTAIVPIEAFAVPANVDGTSGSNRWPGRPRIDAENDLQAIHAWLATKSGNGNTQRAYRKEAERMLLWAIIERGKALSDLSVDDCTGYRDWLSLPGRSQSDQWAFNIPQAEWIAPRHTPRFSADWRPFDGALSASSVKHAITILGSLFEWLVRVQYCAFNPWDAVGKTLVVQQDAPDNIEPTRAFSVAQWQFLMNHLHGMVQTDPTGRLRFALPFAHATGLRLSELVDAKTGRLYTMPLSDGTGVRWMLKVLGKGGKWRAVSVPDRIIALLRAFLERRGLDADPLTNPPDTALIPRVGSNEAISPSGLYKAIRGLFQDAARALHASGKAHDARAFERASVHWLRHTCGSFLGSSGVPVNLIQKLLGHASVATTSIYTESDEERLWLEIADREEHRAS